MQKYSTVFHKVRWKVMRWSAGKNIRIWWQAGSCMVTIDFSWLQRGREVNFKFVRT